MSISSTSPRLKTLKTPLPVDTSPFHFLGTSRSVVRVRTVGRKDPDLSPARVRESESSVSFSVALVGVVPTAIKIQYGLLQSLFAYLGSSSPRKSYSSLMQH